MRFKMRNRAPSSSGPLVAGIASVLAGAGLLFWSRRASASQRPVEPVLLPDVEPLPAAAIVDDTDEDSAPSAEVPTREAEPLSSAPMAHDDTDIEAGARMVASENPRGSERLKVEQLWTQIRQSRNALSRRMPRSA